MKDLAELEGRITLALDRITLGLEALPPPGPSEKEIQLMHELEAATAALEKERASNAALTDALREALARPGAGSNDAAARADRQAQEMQRVRETNRHLRHVIGRLREAEAAKVGDAELVNTALKAELDALRADRAAERSELDEILAELEPLLEEGADG